MGLSNARLRQRSDCLLICNGTEKAQLRATSEDRARHVKRIQRGRMVLLSARRLSGLEVAYHPASAEPPSGADSSVTRRRVSTACYPIKSAHPERFCLGGCGTERSLESST